MFYPSFFHRKPTVFRPLKPHGASSSSTISSASAEIGCGGATCVVTVVTLAVKYQWDYDTDILYRFNL
jgi:hypothetical protein